MRKPALYKEGDKVFAKVKGYPAWPAVILGKSGKKFSVQFYGTNERGYIKPEDIFFYLKNKEQLEKGSKKKEFKEALEQIEQAVQEAGTDGDNSDNIEVPVPAKRKRTNSDKSVDSVPSKKSLLSETEKDMDSNLSETTTEGNNDTRMETIEENTVESEPKEPQIEEDSGVLTLVSEQDLKNWVAYADIVNENADFYKNISPYPRNYSTKQVFAVASLSGSYLGAKLHKTTIPTFTNEFDCSVYDKETASRLLLLKESIDSGDITIQTHPELFLSEFVLNETEIKEEFESQKNSKRTNRVERLKTEKRLVELDAEIKNSLPLQNADPQKALSLLETLLNVDFDGVMLKKHKHVVEMIRRLRKYVGNIKEWNLSQEELDAFNENAQKIRIKAEQVYRKIKSKFPFGNENSCFWTKFCESVDKFTEDCSKLNKMEVHLLADEPYTRNAILDRLEQEKELEEADVSRPIEEDVNKENHSEIANAD